METQNRQLDSPRLDFLSVLQELVQVWSHDTICSLKIYILKIRKNRKVASKRNTGENKAIQKVDIAEALTKPGVPNGAHQNVVTPKVSSSEGSSVSVVGESLEYEDIQTETKLENCFCGGGDEERGDWHELCEG